MKCTIPEISWHNREPILSVDLHPIDNEFYKLASGGSDTLILIWQLRVEESGSVNVEILSELTRHQKAVNSVRWSPNGQYLASGDDDANIILWQLKSDNIPSLEGENNYKETWNIYKILRGHKDDVYDLCWSPNSSKLFSGSVDNSAIIWDINKGQNEHIITDHKSFVQGVAWDPKNEYLATLSSDRVCRIFEQNGRKVLARISRGVLPVDDSHSLYNKDVKYFHDDTFKTFFRRLNFSPDGSFLVVPSGCVETEECKNALYGTYLFTLDSLSHPAAILPSKKQCSIVAKCCPILFELRKNGPKPIIDLPYRMIIAIATDSDVILYDTQQSAPFAHLQKIHYTRLTDLTWSYDGLLLVASSTDGFVTLVTFEQEELGIKYVKEESEPEEMIVNVPEDLEKVEIKVPEKPKKSTFLVQWAKQAPNRKSIDEKEKTQKVINCKRKANLEIIKSPKKVRSEPVEVVELLDSPEKIVENDIEMKEEIKPNPISATDTVKKIVPKRITPITLERKSPVKRRIIPTRVVEKSVNDEKLVQKKSPEKKDKDKEIINEDSETRNFKSVQEKSENKLKKTKQSSIETKLLNKDKSENILKTTKQNSTDTKASNKEKSENTVTNKETGKPNVEIQNISIKDVGSSSAVNSKEVSKLPEITPKKSTEKPVDITTPEIKTPKNKSAKKLVKSEDKKISPAVRSGKKKPKDIQTTPKVSLLQYFKPIDAKKDELEEIVPSKSSNVIDLCEDSEDVPEDFKLIVEDSVDGLEDKKENNKLDVTDKNIEMLKSDEVKERRRIPLITLSSPKNKKKKV